MSMRARSDASGLRTRGEPPVAGPSSAIGDTEARKPFDRIERAGAAPGMRQPVTGVRTPLSHVRTTGTACRALELSAGVALQHLPGTDGSGRGPGRHQIGVELGGDGADLVGDFERLAQ